MSAALRTRAGQILIGGAASSSPSSTFIRTRKGAWPAQGIEGSSESASKDAFAHIQELIVRTVTPDSWPRGFSSISIIERTLSDLAHLNMGVFVIREKIGRTVKQVTSSAHNILNSSSDFCT